jgi:hypothetical protein
MVNHQYHGQTLKALNTNSVTNANCWLTGIVAHYFRSYIVCVEHWYCFWRINLIWKKRLSRSPFFKVCNLSRPIYPSAGQCCPSESKDWVGQATTIYFFFPLCVTGKVAPIATVLLKDRPSCITLAFIAGSSNQEFKSTLLPDSKNKFRKSEKKTWKLKRNAEFKTKHWDTVE